MTRINAVEGANTSALRNPLDILIVAVANRFGDKSKEVERFLRFAIVGVVGAIVDFGTLIVLQATILPPVNNINVIIATTCAFLAAIISNFIWNRVWTYPDSRSRSMRRQMALFAFISVIGWLGRTLWIGWAYLHLGALLMPALLPEIQWFRPGYVPSLTAEAKLGTIVAQLFGVVVVMFWNFLANRRWTYNDVR